MKPRVKVETLFDFEIIFDDKGMFSYLAQLDALSQPIFPLVKDFINQDTYPMLDEDYFVGTSAEKYFSPLLMKSVKKICVDLGIDYSKFLFDELSGSEKTTIVTSLFNDYGIGNIVYNRFAVKWKKIWDALNTTYNPLENYDMEQTETPDITKTTNITSKITTERTDDVTDSSIYGFNSSNPNPSGKVESSGTTIVSGDGTENESVETESGTRGLTRHGNIGVTTSQQMLQSEFEVRKYDFYKMIYNDIDSILCLKIY